MTTREEWREAVLADPDDDVVKRAYADWLEEHGADPTEVAFHRTPVMGDGDRKAYRAARRRVRQMLAGVLPKTAFLCLDHEPAVLAGQSLTRSMGGAHWCATSRDVLVVVRFGWLTDVGLSVHRFLRDAARLFQQHPIRDVRLRALPDFGDNNWRVWHRASGGVSSIPAALFDRLDGGMLIRNDRNRRSRVYDDAAAAYLALSAAAVRFGRDAARELSPAELIA